MRITSAQLRPLLLLLATGVAVAQATVPMASAPSPHLPKPRARSPQIGVNPNLVVIDPAHGGADGGAQLGRAGVEKDFNQAFANRLKDLLAAQNFIVTFTHADASEAATLDQRAEIANRSHALGCLILHATSAGHGAHLFTSALSVRPGAAEDRDDSAIQPWDTVQSVSLPASLQFANEFSSVLTAARIPVMLGAVSIPPIDSMSCPTVAFEVAPSASRLGLADEAYLQRLAELLVNGLVRWRQQALDRAAQAEAAQQRLRDEENANPAGDAAGEHAPPALKHAPRLVSPQSSPGLSPAAPGVKSPRVQKTSPPVVTPEATL